MDRTMGDSEEVKETTWKSLRRTAITAVSLFMVDALVLGSFAIAVYAVIALVFWMIPRTLLALKRRNVLIVRAQKTAIYLCMTAAIMAAYAGNNYLAKSRANTIISAVNQFKTEQHKYPESLKELVPKFIKAVPRAKYTLMFGEFVYSRSGNGSARLMYFGFPPFERRYYNFDSHRWTVVD